MPTAPTEYVAVSVADAPPASVTLLALTPLQVTFVEPLHDTLNTLVPKPVFCMVNTSLNGPVLASRAAVVPLSGVTKTPAATTGTEKVPVSPAWLVPSAMSRRVPVPASPV